MFSSEARGFVYIPSLPPNETCRSQGYGQDVLGSVITGTKTLNTIKQSIQGCDRRWSNTTQRKHLQPLKLAI